MKNVAVSHLAWGALVTWMAGCPTEPTCVPRNSFSLEPDEPTGPLMRPGNNCLRCHSSSGEAAAKPFSFGGTIYADASAALCEGVMGVTVRVTDSSGIVVSVVSNEVGNFYSDIALTPPFRIEAEVDGRIAVMPIESPTGGCTLCHSSPDAVGGALGRIRTP
jgi:hypothetical protein